MSLVKKPVMFVLKMYLKPKFYFLVLDSKVSVASDLCQVFIAVCVLAEEIYLLTLSC